MENKKTLLSFYLEKSILCLLVIVFIYLLGFAIKLGDNTLISSVFFSERIVQYLNMGIVCIFATIVFFYIALNHKQYKLSVLLGFALGLLVYVIYYIIYGNLINENKSVIFSNIKTILVLGFFAYLSFFVLPKIMKRKHVVLLLLLICLLGLSSVVFYYIHDFPLLLKSENIIPDKMRSFFIGKNVFGFILMSCFFASLYLAKILRKKWFFVLSLLFSFTTILSICKTAVIVELIFSFSYVLTRKSPNSRKIRIFFLSFMVVFITMILLIIRGTLDTIPLFFSLKIFLKNYFIDQMLLSFDSRYEIVVRAISLLNFHNVWLGIGNVTGSIGLNNLINMPYFHNMYTEVLITGGTVLTMVYLFFGVRLFFFILEIKKQSQTYGVLSLSVFLGILLHSLMESVLIFNFSAVSFLSTFLVLEIPLVIYENQNAFGLMPQRQNTNKKVAFITTIYPSKDKKWYGVYLHNLAKAMINEGNDVEIILITNEKLTQDYQELFYDGVKIIKIHHRCSPLNKLYMALDDHFKVNFYNLIHEKNYDDAIIHFYPVELHNFIIDTIKEHNTRVLHYIHSRNIFKHIHDKHKIYRWYQNLFAKSAYKKCDYIICISPLVQKDFCNGLLNLNTAVVFNGVSDVFFKKHQNNTKSLHLISVSNLIPIKGVLNVIEALNIIKKKNPKLRFKYTIVGEGQLEDVIKEKIVKYQLASNIKVVGTLAPNQLATKLSKSDIFVLPSYYEGLGCVYLEAMAAQCLVIGCEHQGIAAIIDKLCGYLVEENNLENLVETLNHIIDDYPNNDYIKLNAQKVAKKFKWENSAIELQKYL